ncbi:hypothetical protein [Actinoplanes solisilvae]|uniref:hypothetical protein n=1 Tax=Actinoplanes solisilvae TaxID=2486853 RepID=UPI000FD8E7CC|nr:hypothetical protein [Actinoplanes solisilvae]
MTVSAHSGWLHWLSPFGLLTLSGPYIEDRALPLVALAAAAVVVVVAVSLVAAGRRDARDGLVAPPPGRRPRLRLLTSVETFAVRRVLRPLTGWTIGLGAYYLLIGLTAVSVTGFLRENPALAGAADEAGFAGLGSIAGFVATLFAILALPVAGFATVRIGAFLAAETDGRLTLLSSRPTSRTRLIGAEIAVTGGAAALLVTGAGLLTWAGVTATGGELPVRAALRGAGNVLPIVLLSLGAAVFAAGWAPRWAGLAGGLPATGGFLLLVIAETIGAPGWVRAASPFAHLAPVPLQKADLVASAVMLGTAVALTAGGLAGYQRRDQRS